LDDLGKTPPTPRPAPQLTDASIIDGDQNDGRPRMFLSTQVETQIERFRLEIA
jgi:hypothetical protein